MASYCQVEYECVNVGKRRQCGCFACDEHTDQDTDCCLFHVPVDDAEYQQAVIENERAGVVWDA